MINLSANIHTNVKSLNLCTYRWVELIYVSKHNLSESCRFWHLADILSWVLIKSDIWQNSKVTDERNTHTRTYTSFGMYKRMLLKCIKKFLTFKQKIMSRDYEVFSICTYTTLYQFFLPFCFFFLETNPKLVFRKL